MTELGKHCSSGCLTKDHRTFGECMRSKNVGTAPGETTKGTYSYQRASVWDAEMNEYRAAREQGIQPASTNLKDIRAAVAASTVMDKPFDAAA